MKILVINGSPKADRSNSLQLTHAFLKGIQQNQDAEIREVSLAKLNISPCKGCFACWSKTPGKCCMSDDMTQIIADELWADLIIFSFPLYYFSVPGILKNMIDRQLPMTLPFMVEREDGKGSGAHPSRYDMSGKKYVLISTCGFYSAENNYESVTEMFDHICGYHNYDTLFCGQGELFRVKELRSRTDEYLKIVENAGCEYAKGAISQSTKDELSKLLFKREQFEAMADTSWGVDKETGKVEDETLTFTRQMANLYKPQSHDGRDRVLEICYSDLDKTYQLLLNKEACIVSTDGSLKADTRIDTPWEVWIAISRGELGGAQALAMGKYKVSGDLDLMMHWDKYFGGISTDDNAQDKKADSKDKKKKPPVMATMLIAWISFWVAVSINAGLGGIICLGICALIPLIMAGREINIYDRISLAGVAMLSVFASLTQKGNEATVFAYFAFGFLWLISCLTKEPLCASYVKHKFGGNSALKNPIFMKTNYILAAGWGVLYILIAIWTIFILKTGNTLLLQCVNNGATVLMAIFTGWFQNWYPKHMMSHNSSC